MWSDLLIGNIVNRAKRQGPQYILTAFPQASVHPERIQGSKEVHALTGRKNEQRFAWTSHEVMSYLERGEVNQEDVAKLVALILRNCCGILNKNQSDNSFRVIQMFEDSIAVIVSGSSSNGALASMLTKMTRITANAYYSRSSKVMEKICMNLAPNLQLLIPPSGPTSNISSIFAKRLSYWWRLKT
jgi:DNA-binding MurR/RpiR family transcriptional regulator